MTAVDPTTIRLSDTLLLSDFVGNYSAYHEGMANPVLDSRGIMVEGRYLAEWLDEAQTHLGPCRVSYGYIHPEHSMKTVKWRNPADPSLHRWDDGAAADVCFPQRDRLMGSLGYWDDCNDAPINTALWISREPNLSNYTRMITYEQSEWMCIATHTGESTPRQRFYENRFVGADSKAEYIKHNGKRPNYLKLMHPWRGQGHPRRGKEYQHVKISASTYLSDYLYDKRKVHKGVPNRPPINGKRARFIRNLQRAGKILDRVQEHTGHRVSIVKAYDCDQPEMFQKGFRIEIIPAVGVSCNTVSDIIREQDNEVSVRLGPRKGDLSRVRMTLKSVSK